MAIQMIKHQIVSMTPGVPCEHGQKAFHAKGQRNGQAVPRPDASLSEAVDARERISSQRLCIMDVLIAANHWLFNHV